MSSSLLFVLLVALSVLAFQLGKARAIAVVGGLRGIRDLHSLPGHYGLLTAIWCGLPALVVFALWISLQDLVITQLVLADLPESAMAQSEQALALLLNDLRNVVAGNVPAAMVAESTRVAAAEYLKLQRIAQLALTVVTFAVGIAGLLVVRARIRPDLRARNAYERVIEWALFACSAVAVLTTIGIVLSIVFEATRFFNIVPITEFVFGTNWSPQMAIRADQVGSSGAFGAVPLFAGTLLISFIAMIVAVPIGLFSAIYLAEYAPLQVRKVVKPLLEVLAGVPTVVYGFFAVTTVGPALRVAGEAIGLPVAGESALAAGLVMGIMIIPFVSSLSDDMITAVPQSLRDGAYALGATRSETIRQVVLRAALPGIVGGVLLAISRAIGETMIVVMAAGLAANLTANPLEAVTTVTVQIVTLLVGDQEFDSPKTLAAFALGLVLFLVTLLLNVIALYVVRKYREQYD
ncbi:MAG: phosphate ABC transporter permease subunit PstC [Gammaproteobacteria bacterium]|nr:phosphate ABC transporter permease subunit PstC [Gammaproteobacteria bacterium]